MDKLQKRILDQLAQNVGLVSAHDLATALMEDLDDVRNVLGALVRRKKVTRHHSGFGELTYSAAAASGSDDAPASGDVEQMPTSRLSLTERIRSILAHASEPMTARQVAEALPEETENVVRSALYGAVHRGQVVSMPTGAGPTKAFALADVSANTGVGAYATASASIGGQTAMARVDREAFEPRNEDHQEGDPEASQSAAEGKPSMDPFEASVHAARYARKSYVDSIVDPHIYYWLTESLKTAKAARDAARRMLG